MGRDERDMLNFYFYLMFLIFDFNYFLNFFCLLSERAGYGSESEADDEAATVTLASDLGRVNQASTKSAVKLQEIGPRLTLQLIKVEEGLCSGGIIFSEYGMQS